jgi:hypothetical protein
LGGIQDLTSIVSLAQHASYSCRMNLIPDPHGQAALMLCESMLVLLVESGIVRKEQVIDAIEVAIDVKNEIAGHTESVAVSMASIGLLRAVSQSVAAAASPTTTGLLSLKTHDATKL